MPVFRFRLHRRDVILLLMGASFMHLLPAFSSRDAPPETFVNSVREPLAPHPPTTEVPRYLTKTTTLVESTTTTMIAQPTASLPSFNSIESALQLPETSIVAHAPGWTLFRNLYMSGGTFFIVSNTPSDFPEMRLMISTPLPAENTPQNIAMREPTPYSMTFLSTAAAQRRWGDDVRNGQKNRVSSIEGNTVLVNEPGQFLRHFYHLVAELFFGVQAFWHGAFSKPSHDADREYMFGPHSAPPPIHRIMFARTDADGWRDNPGFNAYFLRAAFPTATIEVEEDWEDRVEITMSGERAWHFPLVLLTDRSASHRGPICGSQTQRIASEAFEAMRVKGKLVGLRVGGWWAPVRDTVLRFAGAEVHTPDSVAQAVFRSDVAARELPMPAKIVVTYISRQSAGNRKLTPDSHAGVVAALKDLVRRKGSTWELHVLEAERMTRDEQLRVIGRTTVLLGVHGNGLTHLVMMQPTRVSTVIEIFYPGGFAHDYQWTASALGLRHYAVWNDTCRTEGVGEGKPRVDYPEGFQRDYIPAYGPAIAQLIEDRVEQRI
ncbi:hypothetical protein FB451DRAFT_1350587 [Mycena latifolia]|nr:hypothetical protein FB451DRAFT_1350587 [Mycena latifolia]